MPSTRPSGRVRRGFFTSSATFRVSSKPTKEKKVSTAPCTISRGGIASRLPRGGAGGLHPSTGDIGPHALANAAIDDARHQEEVGDGQDHHRCPREEGDTL